MLEKIVFWENDSSIYSSELNSVNSVFIKMIKKLEEMRARLLATKSNNSSKIGKLSEENNKLLDIDDAIQSQIKKYEGLVI